MNHSVKCSTIANLKAIQLAWEEEIGVGMPDDRWEESLENICVCSNNVRHCLIQFK